MSKKRCFIVVGPESSGTRLVTRLLIAAGCEGDATAHGKLENDGWPQHYDVNDPKGETPIVIRRTLPYHPNRVWPDMEELIARIEGCGYEVLLIETARQQDSMVASQLWNRHIKDAKQGKTEIKRATGILDSLNQDKAVVSYEGLVDDPEGAIAQLYKVCKLRPPKNLTEDIYDGNAKYMEEDRV